MKLAKAVSLIAALLIVAPVWSASTVAFVQVTGTSLIKSDTNSVKSFFISLWGKLKSLSPKSNRQISNHKIVITAGVRGAESVDTLLNPYWKDDLSDDLDYTSEVEVIPLDEIWESKEASTLIGNDNIKLIKLEAEGAEPEVLKGASKTLRRTHYISIDCGPERGLEQEAVLMPVLENLKQFGFEIIGYYHKRGIFLFRNDQLKLPETER